VTVLGYSAALLGVITRPSLYSFAGGILILVCCWNARFLGPPKWAARSNLYLTITDNELHFSWDRVAERTVIISAEAITTIGLYKRRNSLFIWASVRTYKNYEQLEQVLRPTDLARASPTLLPQIASNPIPIITGEGASASVINPVLENLRRVDIFIDFELGSGQAVRADNFLSNSACYGEKYVDRAWWNFLA